MSDALVLIPTYNEKENVEKMIRFIFSLPTSFDLLIIDDNSPDGTADIIKGLQKEFDKKLFLLERKGKQGLGTAYIAGFNWGLTQKKYSYFFEIDCDFSHNPKDLIRLYETCKEDGYDLSVGSRYITGANVVNWPITRILISYGASIYVRIITRMKVKDATSGFKCYTRKVLESINFEDIKFKGYAFQIEMKFKAWQNKFKIKEIPIIFTDRKEGTSKMSGGIFYEAILGVLKMKILSLFK